MKNIPATPSGSIYVGDLLSDVSEGLLFETFKRVGTVSSIRVCRDSITKKSLGYAYVNFVNYDDARRAIDTLNNSPIKGRPCRIMWSLRDPTLRKSGVGNIFIRNLDTSIGPKELHDTFSQFGNIISVKVATYPNGQSKGYGYVHFENQSNAEQAIKIVNGRKMGENVVYVSPFIPRNERLKRVENTWTNVYVRNLDVSDSEDDLKNLFGKFGDITSCVVMKKDNIDLKFGFVNFREHNQAVNSLQLNGFNHKSRAIECYRAQKKSERQNELKRKYELIRKERISSLQGRNLYVKNIEDHINEEKLRKEFEPYGKIVSVAIMRDKGISKGFGFVCYSNTNEAQRAIAEIGKNKILPNCSKPLYVAVHEPKEIRQSRFTSRMRTNNKVPQQQMYGPVYYSPYGNQQMMYQKPNWNPVQGQQPQPHYQIPGSYMVQNQQKRNNSQGSNQRRNQTGQQPPQQPPQQPQRGNDVRKDYGEQLYNKIFVTLPDLASKITGMIVHSQDFTVETVEELLNDETKFNQIINEAKQYIESQLQQNQTEEGNDN